MGFYDNLFRGAGDVMRGTMGASLWTGNMIYTSIQNARTKKEIKAIANHAAEANFHNRSVAVLPSADKQQLMLISGDPNDNDVYDYQTKSAAPALDYIWGTNDEPEGMLASGGQNGRRVRALMPFVRKSQNAGVPVVVLHTGNRDLEEMLAEESRIHEFIARSSCYYDAFRGMPVEDVAYLLYETMMEGTANPAAEALLHATLEMVLRTRGAITFQSLASFPLPDLKNRLDAMQKAGEVTAEEYYEINRFYMSGSSELEAVRIFLNKLHRQAEGLYGRLTTNACNIKKTLHQKGIVAINVGSGSSDLIFSLAVQHLMLLQAQGREFSILLDDIPISRYPRANDLLRGRAYAISHNDFVASLFGGERRGEDLFSELTGNVQTVVLFRHASGSSCKTWSEYLGKYQKIRIRYNLSQNKAFMNSSDSRGISVDETEEPRVRAETLNRLPETLACIHHVEGTLFAEV